MEGNPRQKMLEMVVSRLGRLEAAKNLGVPIVVLDMWLSGETPMPDSKVLTLVDLLERSRGK